MPTQLDRTVAIWPWCNLADSYAADHPADAENLMRTGLIVRYITEADIPEDVRSELYALATEGGQPRMARVACAGWVRSVISAEVDPTMPGLDAA